MNPVKVISPYMTGYIRSVIKDILFSTPSPKAERFPPNEFSVTFAIIFFNFLGMYFELAFVSAFRTVLVNAVPTE
jgi:hypothetical protein